MENSNEVEKDPCVNFSLAQSRAISVIYIGPHTEMITMSRFWLLTIGPTIGHQSLNNNRSVPDCQYWPILEGKVDHCRENRLLQREK